MHTYIHTYRWGGDPSKWVVQEGEKLRPRTSFEEFANSVSVFPGGFGGLLPFAPKLLVPGSARKNSLKMVQIIIVVSACHLVWTDVDIQCIFESLGLSIFDHARGTLCPSGKRRICMWWCISCFLLLDAGPQTLHSVATLGDTGSTGTSYYIVLCYISSY
jgi:hypothetical protein